MNDFDTLRKSILNECEDVDCSRWVRVDLPISVYLMSRIASSLPEGTMWVYDGRPGTKEGMANLHVPHGARLDMDDEDET